MAALTVLQGRAAGEAILARRRATGPTPIFAANDLLAVGVLQALACMADVRVPEDIALIGYDDIDFAAGDGGAAQLDPPARASDRLHRRRPAPQGPRGPDGAHERTRALPARAHRARVHRRVTSPVAERSGAPGRRSVCDRMQ